MTISLKHAFTSGKSDGGDSTLVQPSNWNAEHTITMATAKLLGRSTSGTGAVEELDGSAVRTIAGSAASGSNSDITSLTALAAVNNGPLAGFRNRLINGGMKFWQRATASVADDTYGFDRWNNLVQTAATTLSQLTDVENTTPYMMRITQGQASAQRFGTSQIIEAANCKDLRGKQVALSARVRCSNSTTLRYAILEWTGTADSVTSDVVNDWTSSTYTAGNFFNSTTLTVTATGSTALTANTLATIGLNTTLGSSTNNVIVIIWTDSTQAQNSTLDIGKAQFEVGLVATPYEYRPDSIELALCQRYFESSFEPGTAPADAVFSQRIAGFAPASTEIDSQFIGFRVWKRNASYTTTFYRSSQNSSAGKWGWFNGSSYADATATIVADSTPRSNGFSAQLTVSGATQFAAYILKGNWAVDNEL